MSVTELKAFQEKLDRLKRKLERSPKARKQFLIDAGIMTKNGNFKRKFRALG